MRKDVFYSLTLIKHNIKIRNQRERKLRFLSHLFFSLIVIVIIIFLCYHDYYNYQIVYHHHDNCYFCLHLYPFVECPNITFKNSWYIISVYGWFWHWNRDDCKMNANLSYPDKSRGSFEGHKSLHLSNESKISDLCHSLSTAPYFHNIIYEKKIPKLCYWCKISKCYGVFGARYMA